MPRQGPTFIIAGAPRSGTTWLYELLDRHPDVFMAKPPRPEPKFFLVDELYALGIQHYYSTWFRDASSYPAAGEKSTNYLESPTAAERIHAHLPEVKLVFILREPARRAYSNWMWSVMNGLETDDFDAAVAALKKADTKFVMEPFDTPVCRMALVLDPAGNKLMIHQRKAGHA